jgi:hypothetical protein
MSKAAKNYVIRGKDRVMSGPNPGLTMSVNDIEMYYEIRGEGVPLLLLHGAVPQASLWVIPNGGHGPIFGEHTGEGETTKHFAEVALTFLGAEKKYEK